MGNSCRSIPCLTGSTQERVEPREAQVEDWIAVLVFNHLFCRRRRVRRVAALGSPGARRDEARSRAASASGSACAGSRRGESSRNGREFLFRVGCRPAMQSDGVFADRQVGRCRPSTFRRSRRHPAGPRSSSRRRESGRTRGGRCRAGRLELAVRDHAQGPRRRHARGTCGSPATSLTRCGCQGRDGSSGRRGSTSDA